MGQFSDSDIIMRLYQHYDGQLDLVKIDALYLLDWLL